MILCCEKYIYNWVADDTMLWVKYIYNWVADDTMLCEIYL